MMAETLICSCCCG